MGVGVWVCVCVCEDLPRRKLSEAKRIFHVYIPHLDIYGLQEEVSEDLLITRTSAGIKHGIRWYLAFIVRGGRCFLGWII